MRRLTPQASQQFGLMETVLDAVEEQPLALVTVTLRVTVPLAFAEKVTAFVPAPAVMVPFVMVHV